MDDPLIGKVVGGYRLERVLGRGGMATAYLAWDAKLRRQVVVKVMLPLQAGDDSFQARFQQEAFATAKLSHPNIVHIYDLGQQDGLTYMVMEFLPGGSLNDLIRAKGRVDPARAVSIISQTALALDYAHQNGIIHRDVKPANILFAKDGRAVLTDLGIAKALEGPRLTRAMLAVGTPEYMSPEQGRGDPIDGRSDLYSLGIVLYELLSGALPFQADTPWGIIFKHVSEPLPPLQKANCDLSLALCSVVEKALAKRPEDRFQTGREMADALHRALETPSKRLYAPPPVPVVAPAPGARAPAPEAAPDAQTRLIGVGGAAPQSPASPNTETRRGAAWPKILAAGLVVLIVAVAVQRLLVARIQPPPTPMRTPTPILIAALETPAPTVTLAPAKGPASSSTPQATDTPIPATAAVSSATFAPSTATPSSSTATPRPTATRPTATATRPAPTVAPTPSPSSPPPNAPTLLSPQAGDSVTDKATFSWSWPGAALGANQGFEVRIWKEGQAFHYGGAEPTNDTHLEISLTSAPGVQLGGSGTYYWTVAVVQMPPNYQPIGAEAPPRQVKIEVGGGGGGGGGGPAPTWTPPQP